MRLASLISAAVAGLLLLCQPNVSAWPGDLRDPNMSIAGTSPHGVLDLRERDLGGMGDAHHQTDAPAETGSVRGWTEPYTLGAAAVIVGLAFLSGYLMLEHRRRQQAEMQVRHHLATMAHMDRLAAMGQLTASLAHELHQPLGAILRNSEAAKMLLASGRPVNDELKEIVDDIRKDDQRAAEIIRRMRTFLRKREVNNEAVDLNDVVRETVDFVVPAAMIKGVRLETDLKASPAIVTGDRVHLQQVLLNLVLNGLDAMIDTPATERRLRVVTSTRNGEIAVAVRDKGAGIAPSAMAHIFDPFVTTKVEGMGMGLSIAKSIIEAHRGKIHAENNPDKGATVRFTIPTAST
jgi:C4-dicarboxylate-specific signal transduction histidine kinase